MRPIHPKLSQLIDGLDQINGARRLELMTERDGPGEYVARRIELAQSRPADEYASHGMEPLAEFEGNEFGDAPNFAEPVFCFPDGVNEEDVVRQLAGAQGDEFKRQALARGIDAYGWYMTFHQKALQMGVYIPIEGVAALAVHALSSTPITWASKLSFSLQFILAHERFHYAADVGIGRIECILEWPMWWPIRESRDLATMINLEEQLATAFALRRLRYSRELGANKAYRDLVAFTKTLPPGYRVGYKLVNSRADLEDELLRLPMKSWKSAFDTDAQFGAGLHHLYPAFQQHELNRCPTHVLVDQARITLKDLPFHLIMSVQAMTESNAFLKRLQRLPASVRTKWEKTRRLLAESVGFAGLDFKPWPPGGQGCFSVRVDRSIRAHLRFASAEQSWIAESIGAHDELGHG